MLHDGLGAGVYKGFGVWDHEGFRHIYLGGFRKKSGVRSGASHVGASLACTTRGISPQSSIPRKVPCQALMKPEKSLQNNSLNPKP